MPTSLRNTAFVVRPKEHEYEYDQFAQPQKDCSGLIGKPPNGLANPKLFKTYNIELCQLEPNRMNS